MTVIFWYFSQLVFVYITVISRTGSVRRGLAKLYEAPSVDWHECDT